MKPKELKVGDKVFLVRKESFLFSNESLEATELAEVTKVTGSSIYVNDTRFSIKANFPLFHRAKNVLDSTQHLWLTEEDYNNRLKEIRKSKEDKVELELNQIIDRLSDLSDSQLDTVSECLNKILSNLE